MVIKEYFKKYTNEILDLIYPKICFCCKEKIPSQSEKYLCEKCLGKLEKLIPPFCISCGIPISEQISGDKFIKCPECLGQNYYFKKGHTASLYDGLIKECVHSYKYNSHTYLGKTLAGIMADFALKNIKLNEIDCIVPVPLHWKKMRDRGFNQSAILGRILSKRTGIRFSDKGLLRIKSMPSQVKLSRNERIQNLKGAFSIKDSNYFIGKKILLVDDVFTTGATMNECAKTLMNGGAKEVYAFSLSRGISC
jgi:ComF family protein